MLFSRITDGFVKSRYQPITLALSKILTFCNNPAKLDISRKFILSLWIFEEKKWIWGPYSWMYE